MIPTLFEIVAAILMVTVSVALVAWFSRDLVAASGRRMTNMLARAGADPEAAGRGDAMMREVRSRCGKCRSEDLCDRWLAGRVEGDNGFCPNAQIFRVLTRTGGRVAI